MKDDFKKMECAFCNALLTDAKGRTIQDVYCLEPDGYVCNVCYFDSQGVFLVPKGKRMFVGEHPRRIFLPDQDVEVQEG